MKDMHCNPEEAVQIHFDVNSQKSIGMHWGTFLDLTDEPLEEPPLKLAKVLEEKGIGKNNFITMKHGQTMKFEEK